MDTNLKTINNAVINGKRAEIPPGGLSETYKYLLKNNVAYYYSTLSGNKNSKDKAIIASANVLNRRFEKTIKILTATSTKENIPFLLFKTYKYIPEAVDGDIDLFVKEKDFHGFLEALSREGFTCFENEPLKAICTKDGHCVIEPRVYSSFHSIKIVEQEEIWREPESVMLAGRRVGKVRKEIDLLHLLLNLLYGPNYLRLYLYKVTEAGSFRKMMEVKTAFDVREDLNLIHKTFFSEKALSKKFPQFMGSSAFLKWWWKRFVPKSTSLKEKIKHPIFYFYMKYSYFFFNKLVFNHNWEVNV